MSNPHEEFKKLFLKPETDQNTKDLIEDLETLKDIPEEELKNIRQGANMLIDLRLYRMSKQRDGGQTWEKLKRLRGIFNKKP